jgi:hypothetical protein
MDETCGEVLVDRGGTACDGYVTLTGSGARLVQSRVDSIGDERECRAAPHRQRVAWMVGEHEYGGMVGRVITPPALPVKVPFVANRSEHVPAHHVGAGRGDLVDLGLVLIGGVEHPHV